MAISPDLTLDELRIALAPAIADAAVFDGWTPLAVINAAAAEGVDPEVAKFAFKAEGLSSAMVLIGAWIVSIDRSMEQGLSAEALASLKIRERIRRLVQFRLDAVAGQQEALRRALASGKQIKRHAPALPERRANCKSFAIIGRDQKAKRGVPAGSSAPDTAAAPAGGQG